MLGSDVFANGEYVGKVERVFMCTWGKRKGRINSVEVSGMHTCIGTNGVLYWNASKCRWQNRLWQGDDVVFNIVKDGL